MGLFYAASTVMDLDRIFFTYSTFSAFLLQMSAFFGTWYWSNTPLSPPAASGDVKRAISPRLTTFFLQ